MLDLLNDRGFLTNVGDRGVHNATDAANYIATRLTPSYREYGYGLYFMQLIETGEAVGMCGLVKRDYLDAPDLGFSVLERFVRRGYTFEAATTVLDLARNTHRLERLYGVTRQANIPAQQLLRKLGFRYERPIELPSGERDWLLFTSIHQS